MMYCSGHGYKRNYIALILPVGTGEVFRLWAATGSGGCELESPTKPLMIGRYNLYRYTSKKECSGVWKNGDVANPVSSGGFR